MATVLENLQTAKAGYAAKLAAMATDDPSVTYSDQGRSFDFNGYQQFLLDAIERTDKAIQAASGPVYIRSRGRAV